MMIEDDKMPQNGARIIFFVVSASTRAKTGGNKEIIPLTIDSILSA